ncbi:hypothetical protein ATZ33_16935 [Enterococcus silesiacus]|uniref:WxL domain-containing protein n=1 Tax=Enterococcus silesiacus TaxID=332949 RepID=A0A0S3KFD5_9ENTE|nr:isopeptide-forming domain-containing fimbrial protein [Enterococcus silesiacus]ALS03002.1 hypothetical protein ATZ33_16935 [Enterococcus silesiacus]OJG92944.1 hypothetical protein RV15_GL002078 [Enterococcus silesiacus]
MKKVKLQKSNMFWVSLILLFGVFFGANEASAEEVSTPNSPLIQGDGLSFVNNGVTRAVPTFDWRLLDDDGIDLSTFNKVTVNTPAKLTGGAFDNTQRQYYMFFGHVGKNLTYNSSTGFKVAGNMSAVLGDSVNLPVLSPGMIGVKKDGTADQQVFGYDYNYTNNSVGRTGSNFDIGDAVLNPVTGNWEVTRSGVTPNTQSTAGDNKTYIMEQYVKDNEIVAYGYLMRGTGSIGNTDPKPLPVRVHGSVVDFQSGRIRFDVNYYNDSGETKNFAMTHGSHMDVGGNHMSSKLYSYGEAGLYFNEPNKTLADGIPARIYFFTNLGYGESLGPNALKTGDLDIFGVYENLYKISHWTAINKNIWTNRMVGRTNAYEPWDTIMPKDHYYPLSHPIFALRWPLVTVLPYEIGHGALDMSIEEPAELKPGAQKTFKNLTESIPKKNLVGDTLEFTLTATNHGAGVINDWQQIMLADMLPKELELVRESLSVTDVDGTVTNLAPTDYDYDPGVDINTFRLKNLYTIPPDKEVTIKYKAKIISGVNTTITNQFLALNPQSQNALADVKISISAEPAKPEATKIYKNETTSGDSNRVDDTLSFELTATNTGGSVWEGVTWTDTYPNELELDKFSFELVDAEGVGTMVVPTFTENPRTFEINDALDVQPGKQIKVRYKAKIIGGGNTTITNKFEASNINNQNATAQVDIPIAENKKDLTIEFVDKMGNTRYTSILLSATVGEFVKLKELAETEGTEVFNAIKTVESDGYKLVQRPLDEASVEIIDGENRVQYVFDGKLILFSAPDVIDFKTQKYDGKTTRVNAPDYYGADLVVKDGRAVKERWTLTAKLDKELTSTDPTAQNSVLKNAILYFYKGNKITLSTGAEMIMRDTNKSDQELYNISDTWLGTQTGDGFKLEVDPGDVKKLGSYEAEILWELAATPE